MITRRKALRTDAGAAIAGSMPIPGFAEDAKPITIGVVTPLSGPQEFVGIFVKRGAQIAAAQINKTGGIMGRPVALEFRDDKVDPALATSVARELLGMGVNLQLGTISSAVALAMGPLMQKENGIVLTSGAGTEKLNHENYTPNIFRVGDGPAAREGGEAQLMAKRYPKATRWTGIIPDHEYGRTTWGVFADGLRRFYPEIAKTNVEIIDPIIVPYGVADYKSFIARAMRIKCDGIFNSTYGGDSITLYQQAKPFGLFDNKILMDSANEYLVHESMKAAGPSMWTGIHWYYAANKGNPVNDQFYADYVALTGDKLPMGWAAESHAGLYAYKAAIEKTKSTDTQAVIGGLKGLTWNTVTGLRTIRPEDNQAIKDVEIIYIEGAAGDPGFKVTDYVKIDGHTVIEPADPGKPMRPKV